MAEIAHSRTSADPGLARLSVIVTGGATGIGAAYVTALVAAGANVVIADLGSCDTAARAIVDETAADPGRAVFVPTDVTSDDDLAEAVRLACGEFGGVDVLINNAAIYRALNGKQSLLTIAQDEWDRVMTVNVRGTWQAIKAVAGVMIERERGRIVNIASVVSRMGAAGFAHYVASKGAVEALTRAAARELGPHGITVNAVAPGLVSDEATRTLNDQSYIVRAAQGRALAREMLPQDLVGTVLWLCSPASAFVTGQTIVVDGGGVFA